LDEWSVGGLTDYFPLFQSGKSERCLLENYRKDLKQPARLLRTHMTDAEQRLLYLLRRKQIHGVQFYRQKPLLSFIVDFYCPAARLVIEIDGSQHFEAAHKINDNNRDDPLAGLGLQVLRFDNRQVLTETGAVQAVIENAVKSRMENPP
jgi:very-short-patch-repair endonuclease